MASVDGLAIPNNPTLTSLSTKKRIGSRSALNSSPEDTEDEMRKREFREDEPLFDHDDWVSYRTQRGDESENIATFMFGGFVLFLWIVVLQI